MSNVLKYIEDTKDVINYCEATIKENGDVFDSIPSHLYYILSCLKESKEEIDALMPMHASPLHWLVDYTGWVSVYTNFCLAPLNMTDEQLESLKLLQKHGRIGKDYIISMYNEKALCESHMSMDDSKIYEESMKKKHYRLMNGNLSEVRV